MLRSRSLAFTLACAALVVFIPPAAAHHQDHIVISGFGTVATGYTAPAGWACGPLTFVPPSTYEVTCALATMNWCAEPTADVMVNGFGWPGAGVLGVTHCQEYTGGNPGQVLTTGCLAFMPLGGVTDTCSSFAAGYIEGNWIEFTCSATPMGTFLLDWTADCGLITGTL